MIVDRAGFFLCGWITTAFTDDRYSLRNHHEKASIPGIANGGASYAFLNEIVAEKPDMSMTKIGLIIGAGVAVFVLPIVAFFVVNGADLKEAMRVEKSSGKLLYLYVPC